MTEIKCEVDHLSTDEIKAVCKAIHAEIMGAKAEPILEADMDELQEEYAWWSAQLEKRLGYEASQT